MSEETRVECPVFDRDFPPKLSHGGHLTVMGIQDFALERVSLPVKSWIVQRAEQALLTRGLILYFLN